MGCFFTIFKILIYLLDFFRASLLLELVIVVFSRKLFLLIVTDSCASYYVEVYFNIFSLFIVSTNSLFIF